MPATHILTLRVEVSALLAPLKADDGTLLTAVMPPSADEVRQWLSKMEVRPVSELHPWLMTGHAVGLVEVEETEWGRSMLEWGRALLERHEQESAPRA